MLQNIVKQFNNIKIRNKLTLYFTVLIVVPLLIMGHISIDKATGIVKEKINFDLSSSVSQISYNLDSTLSNIRLSAESIYGDKSIQSLLENKFTRQQYNDFIKAKIANENESAFVFSNKGQVYGYNIEYVNLDIEYKDTDEYKLCRQNNDKLTWISTNKLSIKSSAFPESNKNKFGIAMIMKDYNTMSEIGMILLTFSEDNLHNVYNRIKMTSTSYGFILNNKGDIISHDNKNLIGDRSNLDTNILKAINNTRNGNIMSIVDGRESLVIYDTLDTTDWKLVYILPRNELMKDVNQIRITLYVFIIVGVIISAILAFFVSKSISKPIDTIIAVIKHFGAGNLSAKIYGYNDRKDEIGVLAAEFNKMHSQINTLVKTNYHATIKKKEAEIEALQAQINPHFLYNTLDCINFIAHNHKVFQICDIVQALGDLMRVSIRKDNNFILVREEINYILNYVTIQKMRYKNKLDFTLNINEEIYDYFIPKLILQPILENAIVHGIGEKIGAGIVVLNGRIEKDSLVFEMIDDGIGFDDEALKNMLKQNLSEYERIGEEMKYSNSTNTSGRGNGIGILNVDMRLKLLYGPEKGVMITSEKGKGTKVVIKILAKNNFGSFSNLHGTS